MKQCGDVLASRNDGKGLSLGGVVGKPRTAKAEAYEAQARRGTGKTAEADQSAVTGEDGSGKTQGSGRRPRDTTEATCHICH